MNKHWGVHILTLLTLAGFTQSTLAADDVRNTFLLEQSYSQLSTASTKEQFLEAAKSHERALDENIINGQILYHTGVAYLLAGHNPKAVHYFERAEQHLGDTWGIERGLSVMSQQQQSDLDTVNWRRVLFSWHFTMPYIERLWSAASAFLVIWLILSLRLLGVRRLTRPILWLGLILFIAFGSSVATTLIQEQDTAAPTVPDATPNVTGPSP